MKNNNNNDENFVTHSQPLHSPQSPTVLSNQNHDKVFVYLEQTYVCHLYIKGPSALVC